MSCMAVVVGSYRPSHPYNAGVEHVGFSPTRQAFACCWSDGEQGDREENMSATNM